MNMRYANSPTGEQGFKHMLITSVETALDRYFEHRLWYWPARIALARDDRRLQKLVLEEISEQKEFSPSDYLAVGWLAGAEGNIALAEQMIRELEKTIEQHYSDNAIVEIVIKLPHKASAERAMRIFEERGDYGRVLNIAAAIGDKERMERLLTKMISEGRIFDNTGTRGLVEAVSWNRELGKQLLKNLENPQEKTEWYMECAGLVAVKLLDIRVAVRAFEYLKKASRFGQLQAGKIAAGLGNTSDAEEMVLIAYTPNTTTKLVEGYRLYSDSLGDIIGSVVKKNAERAFSIWSHLADVMFENFQLGLSRETMATFGPMVAVRVLEII